MLIDFLKGVKRIAQQNRHKGILEFRDVSFINWWEENPSDDWFVRFIYHHFPNVEKKIRFYSVFGPARRLKNNFEGVKIFYSGENLEAHVEYEGLIKRESVETYWKYRVRQYGDYGLKNVDLSLGMGRDINSNKYFRFPEWIPFTFEPESSYKDIQDRTNEINKARPNNNARDAVLLASHDDYGTRERICRDVEKIIPITYAGRWRNNSTDLWNRFNNDKQLYLKNFRFNICPENVDAKGYCTEKLFDAFASGTIPIYHGDMNDPENGLINKDSVIFWNYQGDNEEQMQLLRKLSKDDRYYDRFMQQIKLYPITADYVWDEMQELKKRIGYLID